MPIKHVFESAVEDGADATLVQPSDWNADHIIEDSSIAESKLALTDITTANASTSMHGLLPKLTGETTKFLRADGVYALPVGGDNPAVRVYASAYGSSNTATIAVPATAVVGDALIIFVGSNYSYSSFSAGWGILGYTAAGWHNVTVIGKTCVAGDIGATITVTLSGSEPWNIACIVLSSATQFTGISCRQNTSGTVLLSGIAPGVRKNNFCLMYGSARIGSAVLTFDLGTNLFNRSADATHSSTVWTGTSADMFNAQATLTSPSETQGIAAAFMGFG